ncbi:hypothetical protein AaE_012165, partial [Aphanomyces astaci]
WPPRAPPTSPLSLLTFGPLSAIITNRLQRASALGDNGSAATLQTRTQLAAVTHAVAAPVPPPQAITQADGSVHVMNAFTIPSYAHRDYYARNSMRPGFDRAVFDKHGSASQKKRKRDYVAPSRPIQRPRDDRDDRDGPSGNQGSNSHHGWGPSSSSGPGNGGWNNNRGNSRDKNRDRDRSRDRQRDQGYGRTHRGGLYDQAGTAARSAARPFIHQGNRLNGFANTHLLSHHFVPPSTLNRVLQRPNPPSVLPKVFQPGSAPLCDVFASPPHEPPLIAATTLAPITDAPGELPDHFPSPVDAGDLDFAEVPSAEVLITERLPLYPPRPLFQIPANPTKVDLPLFPPSAFSATRSDIITAASETPIKVVLQLPPRCVDGVRPHPPFQVVGGQGIFALHADLRYCESDPGDPPLPMSVTYRPNDFPALREHWIVDSGASASCTPNRDYFSNYVPCALSLTVGNGAQLPVLGYGPLSLAVDMSSRDQDDDIRPCALRLTILAYIALNYSSTYSRFAKRPMKASQSVLRLATCAKLPPLLVMCFVHLTTPWGYTPFPASQNASPQPIRIVASISTRAKWPCLLA